MNKLASSIIPATLLTLALFAALNPAAPLARAEEREEKEGEHHKEREHGRRGERKDRKGGGEEKEDDDVIERVMKVCCKAPKGTPNLSQKVVDGIATDEETKKLIASYRTLKGTKPPKGEMAEWNQRVGELMEAMDSLEKKEMGAADKFESANACKSCHTAHRSKD